MRLICCIVLIAGMLIHICSETNNPKIEILPFCTYEKENAPFVTPDRLQLLFHSLASGGFGGEDIWLVSRLSVDEKWGKPINIGSPINSIYHEWAPYMSSDGLELYYVSDKPNGIGRYDIWMSKRKSIKSEWGIPVNLGDKINTIFDEANPCISDDGLTLYFSDYYSGLVRGNGIGKADIWYSTRKSKNDSWEIARNIGNKINTNSSETFPRVSKNELLILISTDRSEGYGNRDIWYSVRESKEKEWSTPKNIGNGINSTYDEGCAHITLDNSEIYFSSKVVTGKGNYDIYKTETKYYADIMQYLLNE